MAQSQARNIVTDPSSTRTTDQAKERAGPNSVSVNLVVNGKPRALKLDPRATLLDTLRETLDLTGTKKGCDHGQCGACTVLIDGRRVVSCLTLAVMQEGCDVTTIEGLAKDGDCLLYTSDAADEL